jgi:diaminopimelate epimerase
MTSPSVLDAAVASTVSEDSVDRCELRSVPTIAFRRIHGLGNDYVFLADADADAIRCDRRSLAIALADRHFGVGGDGLITLATIADGDADLHMRMWNADGSESGMCGNGLRGAVRFALTGGLGDAVVDRLQTALRAGRAIRVKIGRGVVAATAYALDDGTFEVEVDVGRPILAAGEIPVAIDGHAPNQPVLSMPASSIGACGAFLDLDHERGHAGSFAGLRSWSCVSMGNPHLVLELGSPEEVAAFELSRLGPILEHAAAFPARINVHVAAVIDRQRFRMRTWERGSGITMACGSGACATFVALRHRGLIGDRAFGELPGGVLRLAATSDGSILMRGEAFESCRGTVEPLAILARLGLSAQDVGA